MLRLEKIPMELLILLVERREQLVNREEIIERLWGRDVFLDTEQGINTAIRKIRLALRDDPDEPRYLLTVVGKGYRFIGPIAVISNAKGTEPSKPFETLASVAVPASTPFASGRLWLRTALVAVVLLAIAGLLAIGFNLFGFRQRLLTRNLEIRSIAVLPLENLSGDPAQEYLADGLTDELITHLAKLGSLKVISRTSVMQYKSARKSLPEIAHALGVDSIVEGSVVRSGSKVRVTVQLIRAANDQHLWAEDYEREMGDVIDLQREIAGTIARQVTLSLNPEQQAYFATRASHDPQLNEAYLRGLFFWGDSTRRSSKTSVPASSIPCPC